MAVSIDIREEVLFRMEMLSFYTDLLVKQCDSWHPEEEGRNYSNFTKFFISTCRKRKKKRTSSSSP